VSIFIPWTCLLVAQLEAQPSGELLRSPCSLSLPCGRPAARRTDLVGKALRRTQTHSDALQRIPTHSKGKSDTISGIAVAVSPTRANQGRSMEIASPASHRRESIKGDQWRSHLLRLTDESQALVGERPRLPKRLASCVSRARHQKSSREINGDRISCVSRARHQKSSREINGDRTSCVSRARRTLSMPDTTPGAHGWRTRHSS
jgi:hypothetical protein